MCIEMSVVGVCADVCYVHVFTNMCSLVCIYVYKYAYVHALMFLTPIVPFMIRISFFPSFVCHGSLDSALHPRR